MKTKFQFSNTAFKNELNHQTQSSMITQSALFTTNFSRIFQSELDSTTDDKTTESMYENSKCHKIHFCHSAHSPPIKIHLTITKHTDDCFLENFSQPHLTIKIQNNLLD